MSHYAVAVISDGTKTFEELLAPYDENLEVAPYLDDDGESTTYNPKSKWDWWAIGGSFAGWLKARRGQWGEGSAFSNNPRKPGEYDIAEIGDVDFSPDQQIYTESLRLWEIVVEDSPLRIGEKDLTRSPYHNKTYFMDKYGDKETFAKTRACFAPYACVTPDGEWHEPGRMGWWGISLAEPQDAAEFERSFVDAFIKPADPEWMIAIVDCHI